MLTSYVEDAPADDTPVQIIAYEQDRGLGAAARIGVIVLQSDQTIEHEFASLMRQPGVALYHSRIPNAMEVTPETLREMESALPNAAGLLDPSFEFDAIGYCCTSGATFIGEERVSEIIKNVHSSAAVTNPITAAKAALAALHVKRIALVTPYAPDVTSGMQANFKKAGFATNAVASFNEANDFRVARITPESILQAVTKIGARDDCDAVFVSCTNLRGLDIVAEAEGTLGKPVITSNTALAWHLMNLSDLRAPRSAPGLLFDTLGRLDG